MFDNGVDRLASVRNDRSNTIGDIGHQRLHCIALGIGAEEEEASKEESTFCKVLCDISGDGSLPSPSWAIEPEHEGICIDLAIRPINDLVDHGNSRLRMAFWRIGAVI